jgi:2,5-diketo-D-gluconate reductase A
MNPVPKLSISTAQSSTTIPQLGFGVWQVPDEHVPSTVMTALDVGYRSIDTASAYENEAGVGRAIAQTDVPRKDIFLTTKLWNADQGYDATLRAFEASAKRLGTTIDLYLIHWPVPAKDAFVDTWKALLRLRADGRVRAAGVCNFQEPHLQRLMDETGEAPTINQIELHPLLQQSSLRSFHARHGILTEAWSPLAKGGALLGDATIKALSVKHSRTPAQVVLRWHVQLGNVVIPKSATPSRIAENFDVFGFELCDRVTSHRRSHGTGPRHVQHGRLTRSGAEAATGLSRRPASTDRPGSDARTRRAP